MKLKKLVASALFLTLGFTVSAQYATDAQDDGFHGAISTVDQTIYEARVYGEQMERGAVLEHLQTVYTNRGYRKTMTYLSNEESIIFRTRYKHDGFGLITLEHIIDQNEQVIGRTYYVYDKSNRLLETYVEDAERQVENRIRLQYNTLGKISQRSYNDPFNNIYKREVYTYNQLGQIRIAVVYDSEGKKVMERRYEYDEHGEPVSYTLYDYTEAEPEVFITLYRYRYDDKGNWLQKTEYALDNDVATPKYITERTLTYFN